MTVRELDQLVTKTSMSPVSKTALKGVRRAIQSGRCGNAEVGHGGWSIQIDSVNGSPITMKFSFRKEK